MRSFVQEVLEAQEIVRRRYVPDAVLTPLAAEYRRLLHQA